MGVDLGSSGNQGGRRNVDAELNLIPFIDLLSVCILFLLMTAVWVQISKMSAFSHAGGETLVSHSDVSSIRQDREDRDLEVLVRTNGVEIRQDGRSLGVYPVAEVTAPLMDLAARFSDPKTAKVSLLSADDVIYEDVVTVLDSLYSAELVTVSIGGLD